MANFESGCGLVRAAAEGVLRPVAVMAEDLEAWRVVVALEPLIENMRGIRSQRLPVFSPTTGDVVNGKENWSCFAAASANIPIRGQHLCTPFGSSRARRNAVHFRRQSSTHTQFAPRGETPAAVSIEGIKYGDNPTAAASSDPARYGQLEDRAFFVPTLSFDLPGAVALPTIAAPSFLRVAK